MHAAITDTLAVRRRLRPSARWRCELVTSVVCLE
jgi:hypothetical protein